MKKSLIIITLIFSLVGIGFSQVTFGPVIGTTVSTLSKVDQNGTPLYSVGGMKPGVLIGFFGKRVFPSEFFLQMGADYRTFVGTTLSYNGTTEDIGSSLITFPIIVGTPISYNIDWRFGVLSSLRSYENNPDLIAFLESMDYGGGVDIEYDMQILLGLGLNLSKFNISLDYQRGIAFPAYITSGFDHNSDFFTTQIVLSVGVSLNN